MAQRQGVTLIGLPGSGKSTVGLSLAQALKRPFVDTDLELEKQLGTSLQSFLNSNGVESLRNAESQCVRKLSLAEHVVATGGSLVYDSEAIRLLSRIGLIVFLDVTYETMLSRIGDYSSRGIASDLRYGLKPMYEERLALYKSGAELVVDANSEVEKVVNQILNRMPA
jgi:shikimate kinase